MKTKISIVFGREDIGLLKDIITEIKKLKERVVIVECWSIGYNRLVLSRSYNEIKIKGREER